MAPLAFKPDSSFFRKIALGAVGARQVSQALQRYQHRMAELERGSTDTKLWKDVKRKRVRIPDLVCLRCGLRVESRAKTKESLSMSHSAADAERAWDFGMVDGDCIAFPVCIADADVSWNLGTLDSGWSYWREKNWVRWQVIGRINYFLVQAFRSVPPTSASTKGVTEGSETSLVWDAKFSTRTGTVDTVDGSRVRVRRGSDGHVHTWRIPEGMPIHVVTGETIEEKQVIASDVSPMTAQQLACPGRVADDHIRTLLQSRERTQRFTGIKLARLIRQNEHTAAARNLLNDSEEDFYIRLEAAVYLASIGNEAANELFEPFLGSTDRQVQLEAVIALGETNTPDAVQILCRILDSQERPYFLRSAAAWSLSKIGGEPAIERLVRAFADVDTDIRGEALEGIVAIGGPAIPHLLERLGEIDERVAAGCAEALRRKRGELDANAIQVLSEQLRGAPSQWAVWLAGHLPRERVAATVAGLERTAPQLHYAITLLWAFVESWIARHWDLSTGNQP